MWSRTSAACAERARASGVPVIHVWFIVEPGAPGVKGNAPLFKGIAEHKAMVRGTWGAAPVKGLEPKPGDLIVEKMTMSAWEGSRLESLLKGLGRDTIIDTGAWTNMSIEHTARTGADKGYFRRPARGLLFDDERRMAQGLDRLRDAERRDRDQGGGGDQGARGGGGRRERGWVKHIAPSCLEERRRRVSKDAPRAPPRRASTIP